MKELSTMLSTIGCLGFLQNFMKNMKNTKGKWKRSIQGVELNKGLSISLK